MAAGDGTKPDVPGKYNLPVRDWGDTDPADTTDQDGDEGEATGGSSSSGGGGGGVGPAQKSATGFGTARALGRILDNALMLKAGTSENMLIHNYTETENPQAAPEQASAAPSKAGSKPGGVTFDPFAAMPDAGNREPR